MARGSGKNSIDKILWSYKAMLSRLEVLSIEACLARTDNERAAIAARKERIERITKPITQMLNDMSKAESKRNVELLMILKHRYFCMNTPKHTESLLHIGSTCYFKRVEQIRAKTAEYLGDVLNNTTAQFWTQ